MDQLREGTSTLGQGFLALDLSVLCAEFVRAGHGLHYVVVIHRSSVVCLEGDSLTIIIIEWIWNPLRHSETNRNQQKNFISRKHFFQRNKIFK